jgi:hypothetical protein
MKSWCLIVIFVYSIVAQADQNNSLTNEVIPKLLK